MPQHWNYDGTRNDATADLSSKVPQSLQAHEDIMDIDKDKVDEITLALLYLTTFKDKTGLRAWKSHSWDVLDRLHESGYIHDPATKAKSVTLTEEGGSGQSACSRSTSREARRTRTVPRASRRERGQVGFWCSRLLT